MTELEFGARLKQLRQNKHMTQQELADQLGVSNKSVSRWESGGYPDIATLFPLAQALDVSVDELLGGLPSTSSPEPSNWKNLISYGFVLGGGIVFYLLDLVLPLSICCLVYLTMMAYGVYLQNRTSYHKGWFYGTTAAMNTLIYLHLTSFWTGVQIVLSADVLYEIAEDIAVRRVSQEELLVYGRVILGYVLPWIAIALLLTGVTHLIIWRVPGNKFTTPSVSLSRSHFSRSKAIPALVPLVLALFWIPYCSHSPLPAQYYEHQNTYFTFLWCLIAFIVILFLWLTHHPAMLLPAALSLWCCRMFPKFAAHVQIFSKLTGNLLAEDAKYNAPVYLHFGQFGPALLLVALLLGSLYLICCFLKITWSPTRNTSFVSKEVLS